MAIMHYNLSLGTKITDHFTLIKEIGRGGFGKVFQGKRVSNGELVALKVIDKRKLKPELNHKVRNEIDIHKSLDYHSVTKMYDWLEDEHYICLVLEFCRNGDLHHFLKRRGKPLPEHEARELFSQLVDGVIHLHANNIVHRDISLNNLLLNDDMGLKISDFGFAKRLSGPQDKHRTMCGTPNFIPPETLSNTGQGFAGDCWSLGCVLYHLLTGELPFEDKGVNEILRRVKSGKFKIPDTLSVDARSLIGLLLQLDPENRVSAQDILKHSFMTQTVFSGESADSGHGTLDSKEVNHFLPSFILPSQTSSNKENGSYLRKLRSGMRPATTAPSTTGPIKIPSRPPESQCDSPRVSGCESLRGAEAAPGRDPTLLRSPSITPSCRKSKPGRLNTVRLPARLQQRKGLEVEVCQNGSISLRRKLDTGTEEFRVSGDGMEISVLTDSLKLQKMSYSTLQPRWYSRYEKLALAVNVLKSSTPKITIHIATASAYYMENSPDPAFQVVFQDGYKLSKDCDRCSLTAPDKEVTLVTLAMTPALETCSSIKVYLDTARQLYGQCVTVEKCLESVNGVIYPVRMGNPPLKTQGNTSLSSSTTQSTSYLTNMPCSMAASTCAGSMVSSTPMSHDLRRSPSLGVLCRSPLTPISSSSRRAASCSPQKHRMPRRSNEENCMSRDSKEDFSCDEGDKENRKTTIVQEEELVEYKPGVGWLLYTNGGAKLKFKDESELVLKDTKEVFIKQPNYPPTRLVGSSLSPHRDNIIELHKLVERQQRHNS